MTTTTVPGTGADEACGAELVRSLGSVVRVMAHAVTAMRLSADDGDLAGFDRAERTYRAAGARYDELCSAAVQAGYLTDLVAVPDKPALASGRPAAPAHARGGRAGPAAPAPARCPDPRRLRQPDGPAAQLRRTAFAYRSRSRPCGSYSCLTSG